MEISNIVDVALLQAIKYCGHKQTKLAKLIGVSSKQVNYWLNSGKCIPFHHAIAIEKATHGTVSRYDLAPYARSLTRKDYELKTKVVAKLSEKAMQGVYYEEQLVQSKKCSDSSKKVDFNLPLKGKTRDKIAQQVGLGSGRNYDRVKYVAQHGIHALVEAMDEGRIVADLAYEIAKFDPLEQENYLLLDKKALRRLLKKPSQVTLPNTSFLLKRIEQLAENTYLKECEQRDNKFYRFMLLMLLIFETEQGVIRYSLLSKRLFKALFYISLQECLQNFTRYGWIKQCAADQQFTVLWEELLNGKMTCDG